MDFVGVPARVGHGDRLHHVDGQLTGPSFGPIFRVCVRSSTRFAEPPFFFSQRDEIIVRIAEGADPTRILGKHKYKSILKAGWPYDPSPVSCVFVYNYQSNGDPSDRAYTRNFCFFFNNPCVYESINASVDNWREHVPSDVDAPPPDHFRNPYPTPTWVVRPSYLSDLTLSLPGTLPRSPRCSPEPLEGTRGYTRREGAKPEPDRSFRMCCVYCPQYTPSRGCRDAR